MTDKFEILSERLKAVAEGFEILKNAGIDEDIMKTYISAKTKLPKKDIDKMLSCQEEFYNKLIKKEVARKLTENEE